MEKTCPKYPLIKTIGIQLTILFYARRAYEPILDSLKEADSETAELLFIFIKQQLDTVESLIEIANDQFDQAVKFAGKECYVNYVDLDIMCCPIGDEEEPCAVVKIPKFPQETQDKVNLWKV